ncbi:hypothetical protein BCY91_13890 [Pelobium manganitolerans]|uniref:Response regulatory domain-containing protein n=1 Tax=Pelobium manganitolerans TaxID=1842495 RepID=A0A419S9W0_9SPHI|nr:response regulator [Pelobium manganitolerans]RKD18965.1 hypothetical protein BCY91_13890 [Pelobium manganitolerans]
MEKLKGVIIANSKLKDELTAMLKTETVQVIDAFEHQKDAIEHINQLEPNLLFLETQAGELATNNFLAKLTKQPTLVFLTKDEASLQTFKANKLHYLSLPIHPQQLKQLLAQLTGVHSQLADKMKAVLGKLKLSEEP